jgi:hypothetical protein
MILAISNIIGGYNPPKVIDENIPEANIKPTISGDPIAGSTLSVSNGDWLNSPLFFYYQWKRGAESIEGETKNTYTTRIVDVGFQISCFVAATNLKGKSEYVNPINSIEVTE